MCQTSGRVEEDEGEKVGNVHKGGYLYNVKIRVGHPFDSKFGYLGDRTTKGNKRSSVKRRILFARRSF